MSGADVDRASIWPLDAEDLRALDDARTMTPLTLHMVAAAMVQKHLRQVVATLPIDAEADR